MPQADERHAKLGSLIRSVLSTATQLYSGLTMEAQSEEGPPPTPVDQIFDDNAISLMASEWGEEGTLCSGKDETGSQL
ncbi:UNVERIFIED_CONTAM: hypothetical protein FKN15_020260 [Acipenser sinensis]